MDTLDVESAVRSRYSDASGACEADLCCPVQYDCQYLDVIPPEVIERDYGCGDPSKYAHPGDTVLDLGSGGGKICFILSQLVGEAGRVIGVDMNTEMLDLARRSAPQVAENIGYANVEFRRGRIQDLATDMDAVDAWLQDRPVTDADTLSELEAFQHLIRSATPLIANDSVDLIVSNCVLNLVPDPQKPSMLREMYRVLRRGGRIAISDIVADRNIPQAMKSDPKLWSGCISGAYQEHDMLTALEAAGFHGIRIAEWSDEPWREIDGIAFRAIVLTAHKGKEGPCPDAGQAVIYRGPWSEVRDDDGHVFRRGVRTPVCTKTFDLLTQEPYAEQLIGVDPNPARVSTTDESCDPTTGCC
jgi:arsenite methyltransferase